LQLNTEYPPADEAEDVEHMVEHIKSLHHPQTDGRVLRAQHAKDTGSVRARFLVDPDLPQEYRFGVFREPRTYEAIVRFSNASDLSAPDGKGTARGMAIKVLKVEGARAIEGDAETDQDFLLVDAPSFVIAAVKDYTMLFGPRRRIRVDPLALLIFSFSYPRQARKVLIAKTGKTPGKLIQRYWSMTPFRLGPRAVKFSAKPEAINFTPPPSGHEGDSDFLFERLADHLKNGGAAFEFMVQFQTDAERMKIEDAMTEWSEAESPFRCVARLVIPAQDVESQENRAFRASVERLSFTPWHALADHRPLGGLNRLRRVAYEASLQRRREAAVQRMP
jgi:hypothetical protein